MLLILSFVGSGSSYALGVALSSRSYILGPFTPGFSLVNVIKNGAEKFLPPDAHVKASGRLRISVTRLSDGKNVILNQFDSREELIQV